MRFNLHIALMLIGLLCLGTACTGFAMAEDYLNTTTYGAYPGAPQSVPGQTASTVTVEKTVSSVQTGKPVIQLGSGGRTSSTVSSSTVTAVYTNQAPPATQQNVLLSYDVQTAPPSAVYYSGTTMSWTAFAQNFPRNSPAFWVASSSGWSWQANCPAGSWIQNLMYVPYTGTMKLYEFYPDGSVKLYSYGFVSPGYKYIWFYADTVGRHISLFTLFDKPSNYLTIDVY